MDTKKFDLPEYRCPCGKLLFKGALMLSQVEVKCRYCGQIRVIGERYGDLGQNQYAFLAAMPTVDAYEAYDPSPFVVDMTDSVLAILGWKREELVGKEVKTLDPLSDSGAYGELWRLIRARKFQPLTLEVYQPKKDGGFVKSRSRTVFQCTNDTMYLHTVFDLLEDPSVPNALLPEHVDLDRMFSSCALEIDTDGVCDMVSYEFASLLGYTIADISNRPCTDLYPKNIAEERARRLREMALKRRSFRIEEDILQGKNGSEHLFDIVFTTRYASNGVFDGFSVTLWPVSSPTHRYA